MPRKTGVFSQAQQHAVDGFSRTKIKTLVGVSYTEQEITDIIEEGEYYRGLRDTVLSMPWNKVHNMLSNFIEKHTHTNKERN